MNASGMRLDVSELLWRAAAAAIGAAERYKKKMKLKKRGALSTADLPGLSGIDLDSE